MSWLVPSVWLTSLSGISALSMLPSYSGIWSTLQILPFWMMIAALGWSLFGPIGLVSMVRLRVDQPFSHMVETCRTQWPAILLTALGMLIAGFNMITFMWTKPLLNQMAPFWADPMLAQVDYWLFLGHDPWQLLSWLNAAPTAIFYHRGWFAMMLAILLMIFSRPSSNERSALIVTYFLLWSVVGPMIHLAMPAGGPIFFEQLGYGDRFAAIPLPSDIVQMKQYLWTSFESGDFGPGSGISAMPSLHIATVAWMQIATHVMAPRWMPVMASLGLLIFLLSISLGWHYAVDGLVGAAAAILCYRACYRVLGIRAMLTDPAAQVSAGGAR